jgi:putative N6-adenine-specific DNA methylase
LKNNNNKTQIVVKTLTGLEDVLAGELLALGIESPVVLNRAVEFHGTKEQLYKANYFCRTALRALKVIGTFTVVDEHDLYNKIKQVNWSDYLSINQTLAVNAVVNRSRITHSQYAALKAKDAIVDQFREQFNKRPSVDLDDPDLRINVHLNGTDCTLSIDSSGEPLFKRGYRRVQGEAPMSEVLAAGMIMLSGWDGKQTLLDPMCGSGTILSEACMISGNVPAGHYRRHYAFEKWRDFDAELWEKIKVDGRKAMGPVKAKIVGYDKSPRALNAAQINIKSSRFEKFVELKAISFEHSTPPAEEGVLITNPPYGERIENTDLPSLYKMIGDVLKKYYSGWEAWLITSDSPALKSVGLRTSKKIVLYNGPLECRFVKYELYQGSKKTKFHQ